MFKILGSLVLILGFLSAGSITATVDSTELVAGDSVMLTLAVTGQDSAVIPDIEEISGEKVFNIQRRSSSNFVYVNGKSSMEKTQILMLEFRPKKNMTIPPFSVKVDGKIETTNTIDLKVLKSATGLKRETKDFSLDMKIAKPKFYLGESIVLNVYFKQRTNVEVMQIEYTPPKFKDFFSKQIGEGKTYRKGAFTVQELNYLLIAKKSGKLTLEPAYAKVAQRSRQRQRGGWFVDIPEWTKLSSPALSVEVIEPSEAHDIVGQFRLNDKVEQIKVKANKPVTLRIELLGKGNLEDYDGMTFDIPSVTMYSDDAKIESKLMGQKLQSRYQKSFVFISDHNFTIPSKEIRVYDFNTGKVNLLKTKEYKVEVESVAKSILHSNAVVVHSTMQTQVPLSPWHERLPSVLALFLAFVLGILVTLGLKYLPSINFKNWNLKGSNVKYEEALKVLYPKMGESTEIEEMVRKLYAFKLGDKSVEIDKIHLKKLLEKYK